MNKYFAKFSLVKPQEIFLRYRSDAAREDGHMKQALEANACQ